jgi:hypothetical protein|tara:strand:+ start:154 stop:279 length:126 start_codon:yes stop_codon:yes gene_type:complete
MYATIEFERISQWHEPVAVERSGMRQVDAAPSCLVEFDRVD